LDCVIPRASLPRRDAPGRSGVELLFRYAPFTRVLAQHRFGGIDTQPIPPTVLFGHTDHGVVRLLLS